MENGTSLTNLVNESGYGSTDSKHKMTILNYSHPTKRPVQSVGATSQTSSIPMMDQSRQQAPATILQSSGSLQHSAQLHNLQQLQQQPLYNDKVHPQKMILQLQRDPKTGALMLNNNQGGRSHNLIHVQAPVASHGYHPGRHLHHQLQLKHTPQSQGTRMPSTSQPQQQLSHLQQQVSSHRNQYPPNFDNTTYTRTYPQTNQQSFQYTYSPAVRSVVRTRYISPNHPSYQQILAQSQQQHNVLQSSQQQAQAQQHAVRQIQQQFPRANIISSQTRYAFQNQSASSQSVRTEKLSHFDYGEHDIVTTTPVYNRAGVYKRAIENEDKSTLRKAAVSTVSQSSYNPNYVGRQQIIGQVRANHLAPQPNIISTQPNPQYQSHVVTQPNIIAHQLRNPGPQQVQSRILANRATPVVSQNSNVVNQVRTDGGSSLRPVILTAQQAGQTIRPSFPGNPVVLQINGGKSIKGSIVSLNNQQQNQPAPIQSNSTHVYFTIPQGNQVSAAKFIKTPNGHLKPVNGIAVQNSLSQSKMYTVRYAVAPKSEDGKSKQQFAIYTPVTPGNNVKILNSSSPNTKTEKPILPKSTPPLSDGTRKRKPTPSKPSQPNKLTRIEPKPSVPAASPGHTELLQRVSKSLEADRDVVQRPDTDTPFESYPDAFRKLMKYHIYFEADVKESYLRKVDKIHEDVSQRLLNRKMNIFNKLHGHLLDDASQPLPGLRSSLDYLTLLNQSIIDEREKLQEVKQELAEAKKDAEIAKNSENQSPVGKGASSDDDE